MSQLSRKLVQTWVDLGPRFLPFADTASPALPWSRLLRLSLFQVSVGMAMVLLVGTLNRVMIVELGVSASLVAAMIALPVIYAPARALIGFRSDHHRSALGWRRVPFLWMGTLLQFGGLAVMPFALLVLGGGGQAAQWPAWVGQAGAAIAFLLVGAGMHTVQTAGLALATDLAAKDSQPRVVGLMSVVLLLGSIAAALGFGALLHNFTPGRLVEVIQGAAVLTVLLNTLALWKQEARHPQRRAKSTVQASARPAPEPSFVQAWRSFTRTPDARRRLLVIVLGTLAFGMQDVLLEPYGAQVLGMGVGATTALTAAFASGAVLGLALASVLLGRGGDAHRVCMAGVALGIPAFAAILGASTVQSVGVFSVGVMAIGLGVGLFGHGTLTLAMKHAPRDQVGLALGAWGAAQATAAGVGVLSGGVLRDVAQTWLMPWWFNTAAPEPVAGYAFVYGVEVLLLVLTLVVLRWRHGGMNRQRLERTDRQLGDIG